MGTNGREVMLNLGSGAGKEEGGRLLSKPTEQILGEESNRQDLPLGCVFFSVLASPKGRTSLSWCFGFLE